MLPQGPDVQRTYFFNLHHSFSSALISINVRTMKEVLVEMPSTMLEAQLAEGRTIRHKMVRQKARLEDIILTHEVYEIPELHLYYEELYSAAVESLEFADAVIALSHENLL